MKIIANENATFTFLPNGPWLPGTTTTTTVQPIVRLRASGKSVIAGATFVLGTCILSGAVFVVGTGTITGTVAVKVKSDKMTPLTTDDEGICLGSFTVPGGVTTCSCKVRVATPGQTKVSTK